MDNIIELYRQIEECTVEQTKCAMISELSLDEFVGYLQYRYSNLDINCELSSNNQYVIKNGNRTVITFSEDQDFGVVYQALVEGEDNVFSNISNEETHNNSYRNVSSSVYSNLTENYVIRIDEELYGEIIEKYRTIFENIQRWKRSSDSSIITGELRNYYNSINGNNDVEGILNELTYDFDEILMKIEATIEMYGEIDQSLHRELDSMIRMTFTLDTSEFISDTNNLSYEERREYVSRTISSLSDVLIDLQDMYNDLYPNGIPTDSSTVMSFICLLEALGIYGNVELENSSFGRANYQRLYNAETGCMDLIQLGYVLNYCEENNVIPVLKNYIVDGKDWCESGMDAMFGEDLVNNLWDTPDLMYTCTNLGYEEGRDYFWDPEYYGWCALDRDGIIIADAESIFISKYITSYQNKFNNDIYSDALEGYEFYQEIEAAHDLWQEKLVAENNGINYLAWDEYNKRYVDCSRINGNAIIGNVFGQGIMEGMPFYSGIPLQNKSFVAAIVKQHLKSHGFDILADDQNENTKSVYEMYEEATTMMNDMFILNESIYNLNQYRKLMPYEVDLSQSAINSDYSNYSDELINRSEYREWWQYMTQEEKATYVSLNSGRRQGYLNAMEDQMNRRIGYARAVNSVQEMNNSSFSFGNASFDGILYGLANWWDGCCDFFNADGVRSSHDYEYAYTVQLLQERNEYNSNLSPYECAMLAKTYAAGTSVGNMIVPVAFSLLTKTPIIGGMASFASTASMFVSSTGNNTESLMQSGVAPGRAYLYGSLMGLSEVGMEMLFNGLPGSPDNFTGGFVGVMRSCLEEAPEEFVQTYISAVLEASATGQPIDLNDLNGEALDAALMAIFTAGALNLGSYTLVSVGGHIYRMVAGNYNSLNDIRNAILVSQIETERSGQEEGHASLDYAAYGMPSYNRLLELCNEKGISVDRFLDLCRDYETNLEKDDLRKIISIRYELTADGAPNGTVIAGTKMAKASGMEGFTQWTLKDTKIQKIGGCSALLRDFNCLSSASDIVAGLGLLYSTTNDGNLSGNPYIYSNNSIANEIGRQTNWRLKPFIVTEFDAPANMISVRLSVAGALGLDLAEQNTSTELQLLEDIVADISRESGQVLTAAYDMSGAAVSYKENPNVGNGYTLNQGDPRRFGAPEFYSSTYFEVPDAKNYLYFNGESVLLGTKTNAGFVWSSNYAIEMFKNAATELGISMNGISFDLVEEN